MDLEVASVKAPRGFWRVARGDDPLQPSQLHADDSDLAYAGNRFDCPQAGVLYFATRLEGCFAETLARFRPSSRVQAAIGQEWEGCGFMAVGSVAADWRHRRMAVHARPLHEYWFLDVEAAATHQSLTILLSSELASIGVDHLDVATVRGKDRRVTRLIASWAHGAQNDDGDYLYGGIRYVSRLGDWECWAVFEDLPLVEQERLPIVRDMPELQEIARRFQLTVF